MNFFRNKQQIKINSAGDSAPTATNNLSSNINATLSSSSFSTSSNLKNLSPLNLNTNSPINKQKSNLNLNISSSTTFLPINPPQPNTTFNLSSNINNNNNGSNQNTIILPSINLNHSNKHSSSEIFNKSSSNLSVSSQNSFSNSMSLIKNNPNNIQSKLNDAKAFLESENSQKINSEIPTTFLNINNNLNRPTILSPKFLSDNTPNPIPTTTPRNRREMLKNFNFSSCSNTDPIIIQRPSKLDSSISNSSSKVTFNLTDKYPTSSVSNDTPLSLNLPLSSRSSSASSMSLSSSSSSLALNTTTPHFRLEAANSDRFKEIVKNAGYLLIDGQRIKTTMNDLTSICELGSGTCGHVNKMRHNLTGCEMAVKEMRISGIVEENKRIIMDLDVVAKSNDCKHIVKCFGYIISESDVWICMELMSMCFDKLLKLIKGPIPEPILGKLTIALLISLNYLKEQHNVIHRDIKPSNILIDTSGNIKLCDFGISGNLINSNAMTRSNTGCAGYMAPERISPDPSNPTYDIRADVWSLGVTLVELATNEFPYKGCSTEFEVMTAIVSNDPPKLEGDQFSDIFKSFVNQCLIKDVKKRPKYKALLKHPFVNYYLENEVDVKSWFGSILNQNKLEKPNLDFNTSEKDTKEDQKEESKEML